MADTQPPFFQRSSVRWAGLFLTALILAGIGVHWLAHDDRGAAPPVGTGLPTAGELVEVQVAKPIRRTLAYTVTLPANIAPWYQTTLYAKVSGYLKWIGPDKGDRVKKNEVVAMMAAFPWGAYLGDDAAEKGISAMVSSWRRISHTSLIPTAKGSGGYLNSVLAKQEALAAGYDEAIMLNDAGSISEGSGMNLFIVSRGVVYTPPVSAGILEGITRNSVMELLGDEGVEVREMDLARGALYAGDEMFLTGTAAEVTPIRSVDGRVVGDGTRGPITKKAQELFAAAVAGKLDDYRHWLEFV